MARRIWWRGCVPLLIFAVSGLAAAAPVAVAAAPTSAEAYGVSAQHRIVSDDALPDGRRRVVLELSLLNAGSAALYDVRVQSRSNGDWKLTPTADSSYVERDGRMRRVAGDALLFGSPRSDPAEERRLRLLTPGTQQTITLELTLLPGSNADRRAVDEELAWRVEAVDTSTQAIVAFGVTSAGGQP